MKLMNHLSLSSFRTTTNNTTGSHNNTDIKDKDPKESSTEHHPTTVTNKKNYWKHDFSLQDKELSSLALKEEDIGASIDPLYLSAFVQDNNNHGNTNEREHEENEQRNPDEEYQGMTSTLFLSGLEEQEGRRSRTSSSSSSSSSSSPESSVVDHQEEVPQKDKEEKEAASTNNSPTSWRPRFWLGGGGGTRNTAGTDTASSTFSATTTHNQDDKNQEDGTENEIIVSLRNELHHTQKERDELQITVQNLETLVRVQQEKLLALEKENTTDTVAELQAKLDAQADKLNVNEKLQATIVELQDKLETQQQQIEAFELYFASLNHRDDVSTTNSNTSFAYKASGKIFKKKTSEHPNRTLSSSSTSSLESVTMQDETMSSSWTHEEAWELEAAPPKLSLSFKNTGNKMKSAKKLASLKQATLTAV
jgi:hypothetical protein